MTNEPEEFGQEDSLPYEFVLSPASIINELRASFGLNEEEILKAVPELTTKNGKADLYHFVRIKGDSKDILRVRLAKGEETDTAMEYWDLFINPKTNEIVRKEHCTADGALIAEITLDPDAQESNTVEQATEKVHAKANGTLVPDDLESDASANNVTDPQDSLDTLIPKDSPVRRFPRNDQEARF